MKFVDNMRISTKILAVIALLSCVIVALIALSAIELIGLTGIYSAMSSNDYPAVLNVARGNRAIKTIGYAAYQTILYDGASKEAQDAAKSEETAYKGAKQYFSAAADTDPANKSTYDSFNSRLDAAQEIVRSAVAHGLKNENEQASKEMAKGDELLAGISHDRMW
jgi:methyl-accepting chemotaxis protein